jgi:V/A-type H+-transporting ATPase subunit D
MSKLQLNKQGLHQERDRLRLCERVLPSLDLKRRQLLGEQARARRELVGASAELAALEDGAAEKFPMLAAADETWDRLLRVETTRRGEERVSGVLLPTLEGVEFRAPAFSCLDTPSWLDLLLERLREAATLRLRIGVLEERAELLAAALRKITQRVNLFEKVLIPQAKENIKRIQIHLDDLDRAAVVRSKIAKAALARVPSPPSLSLPPIE